MKMLPLDDFSLTPLVMYRFPPVLPSEVVVPPAESVRSPPDPLLPDPTVTKIDPARPDEAVPDPMYRAPLLP
jgi:hypothetical protein